MFNKYSPKPEGKRLGWKILSSRSLIDRKWFRVREDELSLPDGNEVDYVYVEHPGAALIVPVTDEKEVVLIHTYRITADRWFWEIPAGTLADHVSDQTPPEQVARQELEEEIGATARKIELLGKYFQGNGHANNLIYYYLATGVKLEKQQALEPTETIDQIKSFAFPHVKDMILRGEMEDGDSAFAVLLAAGAIGGCQTGILNRYILL
jgi:ADP-ribose pyrophosphatase